MKFDVYYTITTKDGKKVPGTKPHNMEWHDIKKLTESQANKDLIARYRNGEAEAKAMLPAVCFVGRCMKTRASRYMQPTQVVMLDIDHMTVDPKEALMAIRDHVGLDWFKENVLLWHITPSGKGLRGVIWAQEGFDTLDKQMAHLNEFLELAKYGKFDAPCHDFARISFLPQAEDILYESVQLYDACMHAPDAIIINRNLERKEQPLFQEDGSEEKEKTVAPSSDSDLPQYSKKEIEELAAYDYRGTLVSTIIAKYVELKGEPGKSEVHNYYNDLIKNFRNICNNDKKVLFYLLPRFGHTPEECWSQCVSICRTNTLSRLPKDFYFFLKDNGFYVANTPTNGKLSEYMLDDEKAEDTDLPWLPPVFKELIGTAPKDFKVPMMASLLPIMGTLTSYLQAEYYLDYKIHTTSFFSVIYAPAGTGKGFVGRYIDLLLERIRTRDYIASAREQIFLKELGRKSANDKSPDDPHVSLRIMEPKNSETEFLQKQKDNHGYHMFTFAPEMDSWAKGVKAAGGNKDDMLRIAWDNDLYGQHFKSAQTFKGTVRLYWNVLITGTLQQVMNYFKNVENGLVSRCSFCPIENQEFAEAPKWKLLTKRQKEVIAKFIDRCDRNTYMEPCTLMPEDVDCTSDKDFDNDINWRFNFRPRKTVDMAWLEPTVRRWLKKNLSIAARDYDKSRDVFRRRAAVRGFRLGMMMYALWENPKPSDLKKCIPFIEWWMQEDLENMMKLWSKAYNDISTDQPSLTQKSVFDALNNEFSKNDVYVQALKCNIKTRVKQIIYNWVKYGYAKKVSNDKYVKITKNDEKII